MATSHSLRPLSARAVVWQKHLARQQASRLSVAAFCRAYDLCPVSFYGWRRRLKAELAVAVGSSLHAVAAEPSVTWCEVNLRAAREESSTLGQLVPLVSKNHGDGDTVGDADTFAAGAGNVLKVGSGDGRGLWVEFACFPSLQQLSRACAALQSNLSIQPDFSLPC